MAYQTSSGIDHPQQPPLPTPPPVYASPSTTSSMPPYPSATSSSHGTQHYIFQSPQPLDWGLDERNSLASNWHQEYGRAGAEGEIDGDPDGHFEPDVDGEPNSDGAGYVQDNPWDHQPAPLQPASHSDQQSSFQPYPAPSSQPVSHTSSLSTPIISNQPSLLRSVSLSYEPSGQSTFYDHQAPPSQFDRPASPTQPGSHNYELPGQLPTFYDHEAPPSQFNQPASSSQGYDQPCNYGYNSTTGNQQDWFNYGPNYPTNLQEDFAPSNWTPSYDNPSSSHRHSEVPLLPDHRQDSAPPVSRSRSLQDFSRTERVPALHTNATPGGSSQMSSTSGIRVSAIL